MYYSYIFIYVSYIRSWILQEFTHNANVNINLVTSRKRFAISNQDNVVEQMITRCQSIELMINNRKQYIGFSLSKILFEVEEKLDKKLSVVV